MRKTTEEGLELVQGSTVEDRPAWPAAAPVIASDCDYDGERWDGLS